VLEEEGEAKAEDSVSRYLLTKPAVARQRLLRLVWYDTPSSDLTLFDSREYLARRP
jgi:hypothetical protein